MPPDPSLRKHHGNWRFGFSAARIYARRAEPEPPVTMMLSHFSGGNPAYYSGLGRMPLSHTIQIPGLISVSYRHTLP